MQMSYEDLKKAVMDYYGDTSRSREDTKDGLENIIEEIELLVESLD